MALLTITSPGIYAVTSDYTAGPWENGVEVASGTHYVTILLYKRLVGAGGPGSMNAGVYASGCAALTVVDMGGSIRDFACGVRAENCDGLRVGGISILAAYFRGVLASGHKLIVADNQIGDVGGCAYPGHTRCMGIEVQGRPDIPMGSHRILRNTIGQVRGSGVDEGVGISLSDNALGSLVKGNVCQNREIYSKTFGLWAGGSTDLTATDNEFTNFEHALGFSSTAAGYLDRNSYRSCTNRMWQPNPNVEFGPTDSLC